MKPTLTTPDTVVVGLYSQGGRVSLTGALRTEIGALRPDVLAVQGGGTWAALAQALADVQTVGTAHLLLLTNDADLVAALTPPIRAPAPTATHREWFGRDDWIDVGYGGDADHWQVLRLLGVRWAGRWRVQLVEDLPKARELWEQQ
jgi:hypothetical protein